jgi:hypothetical protein
MVRLTKRRRTLFGEKFLDLANYAAAALVFGEFVGAQPVSWIIIVAGLATWLVLATMSFLLTGDR